MFSTIHFRNFRGDLFGGITAAVVALPLALAFGVASGAGAISGLYGAIAVGFFAALFGGTPSQVSGPTGPMTVVMGAVVTQYANNLPEAFTIVMLGGAIQIAFGKFRLGGYVAYTPYSVVSGFMSGIGIIIIMIETLPFVGMPSASGGPLGIFEAWRGMPAAFDMEAFGIAALTLLVILFWPERLRRLLPPPLAALLIGTVVAVLIVPGVPMIGDVPTGLPTLITPSLPLGDLPAILQAAFILALLGSIDSLLTSLVADSMTRTQHDSNRELIGQGIGNIVAGLVGGLPGAGATMRTVINVRAGGRTPISGAVHALVLLALVLGLGPLAEKVPHAVLAGILMKVGWDIIDWGYLKRIRRAPRDSVAIMLVTFGLTVFVDLITAVAVGIILASFVTARWLEAEQLKGLAQVDDAEQATALTEEERALLRCARNRVLVNIMRGSFSYVSAREFSRRVGKLVSGYEAVVFDFTDIGHIDIDAALAIEDLIEEQSAAGQAVFVSGLKGAPFKALKRLGALALVPRAHRFNTRIDALKAAVAAVKAGERGAD